MTDIEGKRTPWTKMLDFIGGRTKIERVQIEAGREDIQRNDRQVDERLDAMMDMTAKIKNTTSEFSAVLNQLAKDLGYEDKRKGRAHAKTSGRPHKT